MASLIFFDINGTLIKRDSRTDIPYSIAIDKYLKVTDGMNGVNTSARSDKDVFLEVLSKHGKEFSEDLWEGFLSEYEAQLEYFKSTDVWRENADAIKFVNMLSETDHKLSLITGELSIGARYKLEKLDLWCYFPTGGFGEDGLKRFDIATKALEKARVLYGDTFDETFVIGDTILDILTARHIGAKVISITTGSNTKEELAEHSPDYLIDRFEEINDLFL